MFTLLDFLEDFRTNPITGNDLGHNRPVVFGMKQLYDFSPCTPLLFKEPGFLEIMLEILDSATLGDKDKSPKVCGEDYEKISEGSVTKYKVYITTKRIRAYRDWLQKQNSKSELKIKDNYLCFGDNKMRMYSSSRNYRVIKCLISEPLHTPIKLSDIKANLLQYRDERSIKFTDVQIYNILSAVKRNIQRNLTTEQSPPWGKIKNKSVTLEI